MATTSLPLRHQRIMGKEDEDIGVIDTTHLNDHSENLLSVKNKGQDHTETDALLIHSEHLEPPSQRNEEDGMGYNSISLNKTDQQEIPLTSDLEKETTTSLSDENGVDSLRHSTQSSSIRSDHSSVSTTSRCCFSLPKKWNRDAIHFGIRMAVCITTSSLFMLIRGQERNGEHYPEGMWVLITVLFVCWFPNLDAASVVEKSLQRISGTLIGAAGGLLCGFLSLAILWWNDERLTSITSEQMSADMMALRKTYARSIQGLFLGTCIFVYTFIVCWAALQYTVRGNSSTKIISRYNYACILCLLTFYICLMPFYNDEEKRYIKALYRVLNVVVGCILGAVLSMSILPRSTVQIVQRKMERQIQLAGEASQAVLISAAESFSENVYIPIPPVEQAPQAQSVMRRRLTVSHRPWRNQSNAYDHGEEALNKHDAALQDSRLIKSQLNMLRYDPFQLITPDEVIQTFKTAVANVLARTLRIQHTVVLLDGIIRNDPKHDFSEQHVRIFAEIGSLIHDMLSSSSNSDNFVQAERAYRELKFKMAQVRSSIIELSAVVAESSGEVPVHQIGKLGVGILSSRVDLAGMVESDDESEDFNEVSSLVEMGQEDDDKAGRGAPKFVHGSRVCALLFLQLVEHLALRSVRLYQSWRHCDSLFEEVERRHAVVSEVEVQVERLSMKKSMERTQVVQMTYVEKQT